MLGKSLDQRKSFDFQSNSQKIGCGKRNLQINFDSSKYSFQGMQQQQQQQSIDDNLYQNRKMMQQKERNIHHQGERKYSYGGGCYTRSNTPSAVQYMTNHDERYKHNSFKRESNSKANTNSKIILDEELGGRRKQPYRKVYFGNQQSMIQPNNTYIEQPFKAKLEKTLKSRAINNNNNYELTNKQNNQQYLKQQQYNNRNKYLNHQNINLYSSKNKKQFKTNEFNEMNKKALFKAQSQISQIPIYAQKRQIQHQQQSNLSKKLSTMNQKQIMDKIGRINKLNEQINVRLRRILQKTTINND